MRGHRQLLSSVVSQFPIYQYGRAFGAGEDRVCLMMRQMRENTKWIMLVTALAFVGLMVFQWGMDLSGRSSSGSPGSAGSVNGEDISYNEYANAYQALFQQQQQQGTVSPAMIPQIEDAAWDQLVQSKLIAQEMKRRGITVTDKEVRDAALVAPPPEVQSSPVFQTNGQFDITKYQAFLAQPQLDEAFLQQLESYYRDVIPRSKLFFQSTAGLTVSSPQLWRMYRDANEKATVEYLAFAPDRLVTDAQVTVSDADIKTFYDGHKKDFVRPALATVRFVTLNRSPTGADSAAALTQAQQYRAELAGGADFEAVARRVGAVDSVTRLYGEKFAFVRGQSAPSLEQAVFATPVGQVTVPVLTQAGYHLVKVESKAGDTAQVRQLVTPLELSRVNEDALLDRADSLESVAQEANLEQAARQIGLTVQTSEISAALPILPGVGAIDEGLDWVFGDAEVGDVSNVFEGEQAFYILEVVTRRDEGALTLEEATPTIKSQLMIKAKVAKARELLADAGRRAASGEALSAIGATYSTPVRTAGPFSRGDAVPGLGRINAAVGAAFGQQAGRTSPLVEADGQLFLVRTTALDEANQAEWQVQMPIQRARVMQALADARWSQYLAALRESAKIVDNRAEIERKNAAANAAAAAAGNGR